jgi:hypothetical protein
VKRKVQRFRSLNIREPKEELEFNDSAALMGLSCEFVEQRIHGYRELQFRVFAKDSFRKPFHGQEENARAHAGMID